MLLQHAGVRKLQGPTWPVAKTSGGKAACLEPGGTLPEGMHGFWELQAVLSACPSFCMPVPPFMLRAHKRTLLHARSARPNQLQNLGLPRARTDHMVAHVITTASGHVISASGGHYVYTAPRPNAAWHERVPVLAKEVRPAAHMLWVVGGAAGELVASPVVATQTVPERGAFVHTGARLRASTGWHMSTCGVVAYKTPLFTSSQTLHATGSSAPPPPTHKHTFTHAHAHTP